MNISIESDLGKVLNGSRIGDIISVNAPGGEYKVEIVDILN